MNHSLSAREIDELLGEVDSRMSSKQKATDSRLQRLENGCNPLVCVDIARSNSDETYAGSVTAEDVQRAREVLDLVKKVG